MNQTEKLRDQMQIREHEILFIYNSNDIKDRKALGYVKSLKHLHIKEFDLYEDDFSEFQIEEIIQRLNIQPSELINKNSKLYLEKYSDKELGHKDILKVLSQKPEMIKTPIALYHDHARFVGTGYEFIKEDMVNTGKTRNVTSKK